MIMMPDLEDLLKAERFDPNVRDESTVYVGEWDDCNEYFTDSDDDKGDDEKQKSEVSGTRMDTHLISHDGEKIDMGIEDGASANKSSEKRMSEGDVETMEEDKSGANKSTNGNGGYVN